MTFDTFLVSIYVEINLSFRAFSEHPLLVCFWHCMHTVGTMGLFERCYISWEFLPVKVLVSHFLLIATNHALSS